MRRISLEVQGWLDTVRDLLKSVYEMSIQSARVLVFCSHAGVLLNYSAELNAHNFYHLSLCTNTGEIARAARENRAFDFLIYDGFLPTPSNQALLKSLVEALVIDKILIVSDISSEQRHQLTVWARRNAIDLRQIFTRPFCTSDLMRLMLG